MGLLHPEARRRLGTGAEHPWERPGFGRIVGRNAVAVQAHDVGHAARVVDVSLDHAGETARQARRLVLARQAALAGAPGEAGDLAVDPGAARTRVLRRLEDEEAGPLAGREPGGVPVVRGDESRAPVCGEEQLLELSVGAAAEGDVQIALTDEPVRVADGARTRSEERRG